MPQKIRDEIVHRIKQLKQEGWSHKQVAKELDIAPSTVNKYFHKDVELPDVEVGGVEELSDIQYRERAKVEAELEAYRRLAKHNKNLYDAARKEMSEMMGIVESLKDAVVPLQVIKPNPPRPPKGKSPGQHTIVPHLSDLHISEKVRLEEMGGLSEYNLDVFRTQLCAWVEKVIYLTELRRTRLEIPHIFIPIDGDVVSGIIHPELERTNELSIMHQMAWGGFLLAHALARISQHFHTMTVSCTVGNHGRTQQKVEFKERYVSWDYLVYQQIAWYLRDFDNIEVRIPESWFAIDKVHNTNILHWHGDGIKGWSGFPWYGANRALSALREAFQPHDIRFDLAIFGHFHVPAMLQTPAGPFYCNGNWKGGDEYALGRLHTTIPAIQNMFLIHEDRGEVGYDKLMLTNEMPEDTDWLPQELPDVWANGQL